MAQVRVVLNRDGPRQLRRLPAVQADLKRRADRIAAAAGAGMEASVVEGTNRARASVITDSTGARRAEATGRALTRAIDAGRT